MTQKKQASSFRQPPRALKPDEIDQVAGGYEYSSIKITDDFPTAKTRAGPDNQSKNFGG